MVPAIIHDIASSVRSPEYANDLAKQAGAEVGFSATELLGCPRQYRLKKQHPYWEKPSGMYRMTFGSGYHAALSKYSAGIAEETLTWKFKLLGKSVLLVGTPDLIELRTDGWFITDYKVTGNPPFGVGSEHCVEDCVGNLVCYFVGMAFGYGFGRKQIIAHGFPLN